MRTQLVALVLFAVLATAITANAVTNKPPRSRTIVVQSPSDLAVLAQTNSEAMYLHRTGEERTVLYVESAEGTRLTALDDGFSIPMPFAQLQEPVLESSELWYRRYSLRS